MGIGPEVIVFFVNDVALYFPHANLPSDTWVKAAALHWPRLGRIVPKGYNSLRDSDVVKRLRDELNFVVDVSPPWASQSWVDEDVLPRSPAWNPAGIEEQVSALFYDFLDRYQDELIPRYGTDALGVAPLDTDAVYDEPPPLGPRLAKVHNAKMSHRLAYRLAEAGLLVSRSYQRRDFRGRVLPAWDLAMHRRLADVYLAVLAHVIARENHLTPVTDQPVLCAATSGWTIEALAQILLADETAMVREDPTDYSHAFMVLAMETVLPRDLAEIPVERIIEARRRLLPEMMCYREYLEALAPKLIEIGGIPNPEVREAKLDLLVQGAIVGPILTMEQELGRLGFQPVRTVLTMQTLVPPAALGFLAHAVDAPPLATSAAMAAGCFVGAARGALDQRRQVLAGHPTGYLLNLRQELNPCDSVAQIRSAIRRATIKRRRDIRRRR